MCEHIDNLLKMVQCWALIITAFCVNCYWVSRYHPPDYGIGPKWRGVWCWMYAQQVSITYGFQERLAIPRPGKGFIIPRVFTLEWNLFKYLEKDKIWYLISHILLAWESVFQKKRGKLESMEFLSQFFFNSVISNL